MAFGNPYGDEWSIDEVVDAVDLLESYGIKTISLADTVGLATPHQIRDLVSAVIAKYHYLEIGVHLQPAGSSSRGHYGRIRRRLPPFRFCPRRLGRLPFRAGRIPRKHSYGESSGRVAPTWSGFAHPAATVYFAAGLCRISDKIYECVLGRLIKQQ